MFCGPLTYLHMCSVVEDLVSHHNKIHQDLLRTVWKFNTIRVNGYGVKWQIASNDSVNLLKFETHLVLPLARILTALN